MTIILEFPAGTSAEAIKRAEKEAIKDNLAKTFGWTREHFDETLNGLKGFLTEQEKKRKKMVAFDA